MDLDKAIETLHRAATTGKEKDFWKLYNVLEQPLGPEGTDALLEKVADRPPPIEGLFRVAWRLATEGRDRGPVKIGIALLGIMQSDQHHDVLMTLGSHEEFTLYAAIALANSAESPVAAERSLWELAKRVRGWGRVEIVSRLRETHDPAIRDWMLREGYVNSVMYEYLAYTAATTGGLLEALSDDDVDHQLLTAAGDLLSALIAGGPAEDIGDYQDAPGALRRYLELVAERGDRLSDRDSVLSIERFLKEEEPSERRVWEWPPGEREALLAIAQQILEQPEWPARITRGLESDEETEFHLADRAAQSLGMSTFDIHLARVSRDEARFDSWYALMQQADENKVDEVLDVARRTFPLEEIATGADDSHGLGPDFQRHTALGYVLQDLGRFPGKGWDLLKAALKSPVIRHRNTVLKALEEWPRTSWPWDAEEELRRAFENEPNDDVRAGIENLLAGRPLRDGGISGP